VSPHHQTGNDAHRSSEKSLKGETHFMTEYRRAHVPGATWFFTVNLAERRGNRLLVDQIDALRRSFRYVTERRPFRLDAVVVLPDHLHCIWTLPPGDTDFSMRWNLLKGHVSRAIEKGERISQSREKRRERACGNVDFGSTCYAIRSISTNMSITSIGIR